MKTIRSISVFAAAAAISLLALTGCADSQYSRYYCRLYLDNSRMQRHVLAEAMTQYSNVFCRISNEGNSRFKFESNQGVTDDPFPLTEADRRANYSIGIYNAVIVGFGNDGKFYAYDNQCKNCYEGSGLTRYALTMNTDGTATCKTCHRVYDMRIGGLLIKGDRGSNMIQYRAETTGPYGTLNIHN